MCGLRDLRTRRVISFPKKEEREAHSSPDTSIAKGWKKAFPSPPFLSVSLSQPAPLVNRRKERALHVTAPDKKSFLFRVKNSCSELNSWWYDYKTQLLREISIIGEFPVPSLAIDPFPFLYTAAAAIFRGCGCGLAGLVSGLPVLPLALPLASAVQKREKGH